jgi:hypothetical protein
VRLDHREALQSPGQRVGGLVEPDDLSEELVDALGDVGLVLEDLDLDLVDVVLEALDHGDVVFHDAVHDPVENRGRTPAQEIRLALGPLTHLDQLVRLAVADRDDEVRPHEGVDLAELDRLLLLHVARRLEHHEKRLAVAFDLGPLVGLEGVLHRQLVQLELAGHGVELFPGRLVEPDPGETTIAVGLVDLIERTGWAPAPVNVDGAVDDHGSMIRSP